MKKIIAAALFMIAVSALMLSFICCSGGKSDRASYRIISQEEAAELMAHEKDCVILDVRREDEFAEKHIKGALNIPNESIGAGELTSLPDKDQLIMIYCRSGNRSKQAAEKLVKLGYTNIIEFGGIITWNGETASGND